VKTLQRVIHNAVHGLDHNESVQSADAGGFPLICERCYHHKGCKQKPSPDGRCDGYLKDGRIGLDEDIEINPMDTLTIDYETLKKFFKDLNEEQLKSD
jgi:hypothetical protein